MRRLLFLAITAFAVIPNQDVQIRPRFGVGNRFVIAMTRTIEERLDTTRHLSIRRLIQVQVISTGAAGTVLQWRPGPAELEGAAVGPDARMAVAELATADHDFRLALDANGQYRRTLNSAELALSLERARDAAGRRVSGINDPSLASLPPLTGALVASTVGHDAEVFTAFYGLAQAVGKELEMAATFPLPGGAVPGVRKFSIISATVDAAELSMTFTVDQAVLRKLVPSDLGTAAPKIDMTETARYTFDRRIGLNRSGKLERVATGGDSRRVERWEFTLKDASASQGEGQSER